VGNKISISVSGGTASFGSVSLNAGDATSVTFASIDAAFSDTLMRLSKQSVELGVHSADHAKVVELLSALKALGQQGEKELPKVRSVLESIQKNFSWAYTLAKDFVMYVFPALF
jgi:hypothetical protein